MKFIEVKYKIKAINPFQKQYGTLRKLSKILFQFKISICKYASIDFQVLDRTH